MDGDNPDSTAGVNDVASCFGWELLRGDSVKVVEHIVEYGLTLLFRVFKRRPEKVSIIVIWEVHVGHVEERQRSSDREEDEDSCLDVISNGDRGGCERHATRGSNASTIPLAPELNEQRRGKCACGGVADGKPVDVGWHEELVRELSRNLLLAEGIGSRRLVQLMSGVGCALWIAFAMEKLTIQLTWEVKKRKDVRPWNTQKGSGTADTFGEEVNDPAWRWIHGYV
ncbi:hypothetical protein ARMGADRAFT_1038454 [Armillaria gallica]|uniref:Uncharacterized protein n=1 Tax=Armillaria gallica TaxID=47427 RepID=A0A2H3CLA9_ARMGA|nr:hypothetical protein ARMGADRAFT_1038454 [Armillaria gallica]